MAFDANRADFTVGVIGAGAMGQGIVQVSLQGGMNVVLFDAKDGSAEAGREQVIKRLERLVEKGKLTADAVAGMAEKVSVAKSLADFSGCHTVVEAIFENLEVKQQVFSELESHVSKDCLLTSNTSSLPIGSIARVCKNPERVAGFHFFNPVPLMRLVEVIRGPATEEWVMDGLCALGERMGRTPVKVKDAPGFLVNFGGRAFTTEGLAVVHEGVATPAQVDAVMRDCGHFRMGPFQLMDLTGIDVNYPVSMIVHEQYSYDPRLRTVPLHKALYDAGRFGRKTGIGHFRYDEKGQEIDTPSPDHETTAAPAVQVYCAGSAPELDDLLAGVALDETDDGSSPIVAALFGEDCSTFASRMGIDHTRLVAIDVTGDTSKRVTIMSAPGASADALNAVSAALQKNGRKVTAIADSAGFIGQRIRGMVGNLGCEMAQIQIADPESIDLAMKLGLNYPLGPLEIIADLGVERAFVIMAAMHAVSGDDRYRPSVWLRRRAQLGLDIKTPN